MDTSFTKIGTFDNPLPATVNTYDADDPGQPYLIDATTNDPGVVIVPVIPADVGGSGPSSREWINSQDYTAGTPFTPASFIFYVRSRKEYHTITDFTGLTGPNIYLYNGPLTIESDYEDALTNAASTGPVLLAVTGGDVTIDTIDDIFGDPSSPFPVAILTDGTLDIAPTMTELNGIFIATQVNFGTSAVPLKIVGNIVSQNPADPGTRDRIDDTRPSVFIVARADMYLDLLPYFSTASYEWKQLQ